MHNKKGNNGMVDVVDRAIVESGIMPGIVQRLHITIEGAVQGVGFRPFVFRLSHRIGINGWVTNSPEGVVIEAEGTEQQLEEFIFRLKDEKPLHSIVQGMAHTFISPEHSTTFEIRESKTRGDKSAFVLPDIAVCGDCLNEIFDEHNRRYLYPFTTCTNCGPRFSIVESLPYDRRNTTMKNFPMCPTCKAEYDNPYDRRFHAQPNACPDCGPELELWDGTGAIHSRKQRAIVDAAHAIRQGKIVALKGIGGFQLLADARNNDAVKLLRARKHRERKPLAIMFPSLGAVNELCEISVKEKEILLSAASPVVLLLRKGRTFLAPSVTPDNIYLGVMLPYSPVHYLLMRELGFPVVATSGNISEEPICIDEYEALVTLKNIADVFLVHNRPIAHRVDDSVTRVMAGRESIIRRARGYAPLPLTFENAQGTESTCKQRSILAVGAHLKNTVSITKGNNIFISQHIGNLDTMPSLRSFEGTIQSLENIYEVEPSAIVHDLHPDYSSTQYAKKTGKPVFPVQHHYAHILSCMAEHHLKGNVLGVAWDGSGYGIDGTVWGGEFLFADEHSYHRVARLKPFRLPGGEQAVKEPRRAAIGLLYEIFKEKVFEKDFLAPVASFSESEKHLLLQMLTLGVNSPYTSSIGRLFDAVASITGIRQYVDYEGEAAMALEFAMEHKLPYQTNRAFKYNYSTHISEEKSLFEICITPMVISLLEDIHNKVLQSIISSRFHNTLASIIVAMAKQFDEKRVVLSGGCFQNKYLLERSVRLLTEEGFQPYWHEKIPTNDGGISVGQSYWGMCNGL